MSICITTNYILAHNYCLDVYMHYHKLYSCSQLLCGCLYALPQTIFLLTIVWMSICVTTNYILAYNYCLDVYMHYHKLYSSAQLLLDVYMHYHKLYSCSQLLCGYLYALPQTIFLLTIIVWMSICITTNYILAHNYCLDVYMHYHKLYPCSQLLLGCLYALPQTIFLPTSILWMSIYITTNYILAHNYCVDVYIHYHKLYSCSQLLCGCLYTLPQTIFLLTIIVWMSICITTSYILAHNYCVDVYMHYHKLYFCSQLLLGCLYALPQTIFLITIIVWMSICITTNYILAHNYCVYVYMHYHKLYPCSQLLLGCLTCITINYILAHNYCLDVYMHYHKLYSCSQLLLGCLYALPQTIFLITIIVWMSICITTNYILAHNYSVDVYMHYHKLYPGSQLLLGCLTCITTNYILEHNYCLDVYMHYHKLYSCSQLLLGCLYALPQTIFLLTIIVWMSICITTNYILLTIIAWMSICITTNYILAHNYCVDVYMHYHKLYSCSQLLLGCLYALPQTISLLTIIAWMSNMHYHKLYSCSQLLCGCLYALPQTIFLLTIIVWMSICITTNYILAHNYCMDVYMHYHKLYSCSQLLCGCLYALPQTIFLLTIIVWMSICITTNYILDHNYCVDVYMHYHIIFLITIIVWMSICITTNYILAHNYCMDVYMHYHKLYSCSQLLCGCLYALPQTIFLLTIIVWMSICITTNYILDHNYCVDVYMHYHTIFLITIIVWMSICITTHYILAHNYCLDVYMHYHKLYSCSQLLCGCLYALPQTIFLLTIVWMSICVTTNYILAYNYCLDVYMHYHKLYSSAQLLLDVYMHYHKLYSCSQLLCGCLYALPQTIFLLTIIAWMSICITTNYILAHNYCLDVYMHYHKLYSCPQVFCGCLYTLPQTIFLLTIIVWMSICITTNYILAHNYCVDVYMHYHKLYLAHNYCLDVYMHYHKLYPCSQLLLGCLYALPQTIFLLTIIVWMSICITTNYILAHNYCLDVYMHYHKLYPCSQLLLGCLTCITTNYILAHNYCVDVYMHYHKLYSCSQLLCGCLYALPQTIFLLTIIAWMSICITINYILAHNYCVDVYMHYHKLYSCSQLLCGCLYALPQTIFLITIIVWMSICITTLYS